MRLLEVSRNRINAYAKAYSDARKELAGMSNAGVKNLTSLITDFRSEAKSILSSYIDDYEKPFTVRLLPGIQREIGRSVENLSDLAANQLRGVMGDSYELGGSVTGSAINEILDEPITFPAPSESLLVTMSNTAGNLMTEFTSRVDAEIMRRIRMGALGLEPSSTTMNRIIDLLQTSEEYEAGYRQRVGVAYQAEEIMQTETNRAYSSADYAGTSEAEKIITGLKKVWVSSPGSRQGHIEAGEMYSVGGSKGAIDIDETFEVRDYSRTGTTEYLTLGGRVKAHHGGGGGLRVIGVPSYRRNGSVIVDKMLHPHDPGASPGNVINCTCTMMTVVPGYEDATRDAQDEAQSEE